MKIFGTILMLGVALSSLGQSSNKYFGDAQVGAGMQTSGTGIFNGSAGFNAVLSNSLYLRAGADLGFGGTFKQPDNVVSYKNYTLRIGYYSEISEKFAIVPYLGLGYGQFLKTTLRYDASVDSLNALAGLVDLSVDRRYESEKLSALTLPIGLDFLVTGKNVGLTFGYYALISKYTSMGLKMGIVFGKLK